MTESIAQQEKWEFKINPWITMIPIMAAIFMYIIDETISNVSLPYMAGSFSVSRQESTWIVTCYLVSSGIMIPAVDFFCKLFGRKQFFLISIVIFTVASLLCGLSTSMPMIIFSRILQGIGGGGIMPIGQALIFEIFPKEKLPAAMAVFGLGIVLAPIAGPVLGGWITENWSWHYIYFINIPIGILTYYLSVLYIEEPPYSRRQPGVKMDYSGFFFLALWLITLQVVLDKGNDADWFNAEWICQLFTVSVIAFFAFVFIQVKKMKTGNGLIDLSVLLNKNYFFGTLGQVIMVALMLSSAAFLPSMLQNLMGYTSYLSGLSMVPRGCGCLLASLLVGIVLPILGARVFIFIGIFMLGLGSFVFGFINLQIALTNIALPNFLFGFGMVLAMVPLTNISCTTLRNEQQTNAAGLQNLLKNVGGAIGTSIATTMISRFAQVHQMMLIDGLTETNKVYMDKLHVITSAFAQHYDIATATMMSKGQIYNILLQQSTLWGYIETFRFFALATVILIPIVFLLKDDSKKSQTVD